MDWFSSLPIYLQVIFGSAIGTTIVGFAFKIIDMIIKSKIDRANEIYKDRMGTWGKR